MKKKGLILSTLCLIVLAGYTLISFAGPNTTITTNPPSGYRDYKSNIPHGSYSAVTYYSNSEKRNRTMGIYLPPNYSPNQSYNTLYFLHGGGGDYKESYNFCRPDIIMDNLYAQGKIEPAIVVMPDYNSPALANGFEKEMVSAIIPYIESNYSVIKNKDGRALCGYSMGGIHTIDIGPKHFDTFAYLGCFSGATDATSSGSQFAALYNNPGYTNQQLKTLFLSCGTTDELGIWPKTVAVHNGLAQRGIDHIYYYISGGHTAEVWSAALYYFAINIFGRTDGSATPTTTGSATPTATPSPGTAFSQIEAESFNTQSGVQTETCGEGGENIGFIENGDYAVYNNLDFGSGAAGFQARTASAASGGNIEIRLDSLTGTLIGTCPVDGSGDWQTWTTDTCTVSGVTGTHDIYLKFTGGSGYLFNLNWFKFVAGATNTPSPSPSASLTPTPTVTLVPTPSASPNPTGCSVSYSQSDWGSGATVSITIKNNGLTAINGWALEWTFTGNQTITNGWNATYTQSGTAVTVKNASYNGTIPAKGTVSFGCNLTYSGSNTKPTGFTLNGTACQIE